MAALRHGTPAAKNAGCACEVCREAHAERARKYRARKRAEAGAAPTTEVATPRRARAVAAVSMQAAVEPPAAPAEPARLLGPVEKALTAELADHADRPGVWFATYKAAALSLAKALDEAEPPLAARLYPQLLDALGRIGINPPTRPAVEPGSAAGAPAAPVLIEDDEPDALAGIRIQGRGPAPLRHAT